MKKTILIVVLTLFSMVALAQGGEPESGQKQPKTPPSDVGNLDQFGFGPALFIVSYDDEVLKDSKDVRVRGDGSVSTSGSEYSTAIGLEVHYSWAFKYKCRVDGFVLEDKKKCKDYPKAISSGHTISPYLGLYDFDNGIDGIAAGVTYGYWRGNNLFNERTSLNIGLGWTVHKDQLVLADGVKEGQAVPTGLEAEDYTERKDVEGVVLMISASVGF